MQVSYGQLIREHDAIDEAAAALLANLSDENASSIKLASGLHELADIVEAHLDVEDGIIAAFDRARLSAPWTAAWQDGQEAFQHLRRDWVAFLSQWDEESVRTDRTQFARDAEEILGRLRDRVQLETRAFYATALQTGAIALR